MYAQVVCSACGNWTDTGNFCIRCGSRLGGSPTLPQSLPASPYNPMSPGFRQTYAYQTAAAYQQYSPYTSYSPAQYNPYAGYGFQSYNPYASHAYHQASPMMLPQASTYYGHQQTMNPRRMLPQRPYFY